MDVRSWFKRGEGKRTRPTEVLCRPSRHHLEVTFAGGGKMRKDTVCPRVKAQFARMADWAGDPGAAHAFELTHGLGRIVLVRFQVASVEVAVEEE